ncbi:MAG: tetratricopeptide repeat protein, partial [Anaerolineae bacterium]|nr:tetratricopeptide repeat protein [Anaerolineae bacterium]
MNNHLTSDTAALSLSFLGAFQASLGEHALQKFRTIKVQALLIYLTTEAAVVKGDVAHRREALMELLWPGLPQKSAQVNLRQTLYRLRQAIPEVRARGSDPVVPFLLSDRQIVQVNPDADIRLDLARFRDILSHNPTPERLVEAVALYRGDFLSDFYLPDSTIFEDWATARRAEFRQQALDALDDLGSHYIERGEYELAQVYARRQLELDDLGEGACQQLMFALALDGQRSAALTQYQVCHRRLRDELGIAPTAKTTTLYEQVQADALLESRVRYPQVEPRERGMPVFLFTDIQGSTPLWERHREAMLAALLRHNEILEEQIARHEGRILELRGDGVKAVFEGNNPLPCVLAIQQQFGRQDWGVVGEVRIRIGLHGVSHEREGQDYFLKGDQYYGPALHHAARIMDAGHGGQILVSGQVRNAFPLPPGATWQDYGCHELKGVEEPQRIFGLLHPDLRIREFPPLRTLSTNPPAKPAEPTASPEVPNNLPLQSTHFIGREEELAELDMLIADPDARLITIVGPGGIGKTRLALAVAERQLGALALGASRKPGFADGVYFVPLAAFSSPDLIVPALAETLGLQMQRDGQDLRTPKQQVLDYVREKRFLIIMDNFEHLLDGVPLVVDILRVAPGVQILATSRERLLLHEEQAYPIQGLHFPDWERPDDVADYTAAQLFLQAARRVRPNLELSDDDLLYLTRICRLVDGMPLAIELAASWVDMLSLNDIAEEIQRSLDFLETVWRDVPARHRSIRATIDASWGRLSTAEQDTFARLAVFRGGFTRAAAQEVAKTTLRILAVLVNKSLLQYDRSRDRYDLHELLRQYGAERLTASAEGTTTIMDQHSAYYCKLLEAWDANYKGPSHPDILLGLVADIENVRVAWVWAVEHGKVARLDQAAFSLYAFCEWHSRSQEGDALCQVAVEALRQMLPAPDSRDVPRVLARMQLLQAIFNFHLERREQAEALLQHSLTLLDSKELADQDTRLERAFYLLLMGYIVHSGSPNRGRLLLEESLALYRALGRGWDVANVMRVLGQSAVDAGDLTEARHWFDESLALLQTMGHQPGKLRILVELGTLDREAGDFGQARQHLEEALALAQGHPWGSALALRRLVHLALYQGRLEDAEAYTRQSAALYQEIGHRAGVADTLSFGGLGAIYWLSGRFDEATASMRQSLTIFNELEGSGGMVASAVLAEINACAGKLQEARELANKALSRAHQSIESRDIIARSRRALGWVALAEHAYAEAQNELSETVTVFRAMRNQWGKEYLAVSLAALVRAEVGLGNLKEALELAIEALDIAVGIRAFIPLMFLLPVASVVLVEAGRVERAVELFALAESRPFVAKSPLFQSIVGDPIRAAAGSLSPD